jgi:[acyl-carrier-protein] S-malonyltransferase
MIAYIFPGQGSQKVGMGKERVEAFHRVRNTFAEADQALGFLLSKLCFEGPEEELRKTANAQPSGVSAHEPGLHLVPARRKRRRGRPH